MDTAPRTLTGGPFDGQRADVPVIDGAPVPVALFPDDAPDRDPAHELGRYIPDPDGDLDVYRWQPDPDVTLEATP